MRTHRSIPAFLIGLVVACAATAPSPVRADDTDLYVNPNYNGGIHTATEPLVMFSLDYRSNLGSTLCTNPQTDSCTVTAYFINFDVTKSDVQTKIDAGSKIVYFDLLRWSLKVVFDQYTSFKAGIVLPHAQGTGSSCAGYSAVKCTNGGYILMGFEDMADSSNRDTFHTKLGYMATPGGNLAHSFQLKEIEFEFYRYMKGWGIYNGHNGYQDYSSDSNKNLDSPADTTNNNHLLQWDASIESGSNYVSPLSDTNNCTKLFMINFAFGVTNQEDDSDTAIKASADSTNQGMGLSSLSNGTNGDIEMVSYMHNNDLASAVDGTQSVTQYFVTDKSSTNLKQLAAAGGTSLVELSSDPSSVVTSLSNILAEILSVSTTFVSASVPVNVFNRAESLDNVFIALFQADENKKPFWTGNVKKLKLHLDTTTAEVTLQDADGADAIANDGRIKYDALTYWTLPDDLPAADTSNNEYDGKDGRSVARGAAGERIPGFIAGNTGTSNSDGYRKLYYDPTSGTTLKDLNATSTVASDVVSDMGLGSDTTTALAVLQWARGFDPKDLDGDSSTTDVRAWILGDPLHSRPLPISYGIPTSPSGYTTDNPLIYVAFGSNDGFLHFVKNSNTSEDDTESGAGEEAWAFMPRKVMQTVYKDYTNTAQDHPYAVDGPATSYTYDANSNGNVESGNGDKVFLYFGLRRGGRAMYALDVTNPTSPSLAWRITNSDSDFTELGYTFSPPKVGLINLGSGDVPIVAFAGGYDTNKDSRVASTSSGSQTAPGSNDTMGNAFYVVNAKTGALIWKAIKGSSTGLSGTSYTTPYLTDSIPSEIALADTDGDGYTDRALFGDSAGQVWRVDLTTPTAADVAANATLKEWRITRVANLGRHDNNDVNDDRRFFHRPDLVPSKDSTGNFDAIVIGSGDRANPLDRDSSSGGDSTDAATPDNFLYMIKDRQITPYYYGDTAQSVVTHSDLTDVTSNCIGAGNCGTTPDLSNGWKLQLEVGPGEKSLSSPVTVTNTIFFTSFLPLGTDADLTDVSGETATCGPQEGKGLLYAINLADATPVTNFNVTRDNVTADKADASNRYSVLASAGIPAEVVGVNLGGETYILPPDLKLNEIKASTRWRTFWYQVDDDSGP